MFHIRLEVGIFLGRSDERDGPAADSVLGLARAAAIAITS